MRYGENSLMEHAGFKANVMEAKRLTGEKVHALPPGSALPVYRVAEFKKHPANWMEEDGCYVIPVKPNKGLWFDWTMNDMLNTAVVPTVKGCNPITGLKTDRLGLERYENKCPKHNIEFTADRYCEKCGYKWPDQNYVTTPNTLWWDGFRSNDGSVRQFFITEDMMRDIASHMIGKENTVPAFGFAFFKPKERREQTYAPITLDNCGCNHWHIYHPYKNPLIGDYDLNGLLDKQYGGTTNGIGNHQVFYSSNSDGVVCDSMSIDADSIKCSSNTGSQNYSSDEVPIISQEQAEAKYGKKFGANANASVLRSIAPKEKQSVKKEVAVGAGAKIEQGLIVDPYDLDSWKDEPDSIMRIYFVFQEELEHWKSFGMKDLDGKENGMLDNLPVG